MNIKTNTNPLERITDRLLTFMTKIQNLINAVDDGKELDEVRRLARDAAIYAGEVERGIGIIWNHTKRDNWERDVRLKLGEIASALANSKAKKAPKKIRADLETLIEKASPIIFG
jgi:hypothetical protein